MSSENVNERFEHLSPYKPTEIAGTAPKGVVPLLAALAAMGALATNIILPSFPSMAKDLGTSIGGLSSTLSSFFMVFAIGQLIVGPLSDRFGRQRLVVLGLIIFTLGSLICAAANSLNELIAGRIIQALGVCATAVLSRAIARDLFDGQQLAKALSLTMVAMAAAPGFSPLLGGAINGLAGWRASFIVMAIIAVALAALYSLRLGETHATDKRSALALPLIVKGYASLSRDRRLMIPAVAVSLVIGSLYAFFAMAPAILIGEFELTSLEFGLFFASTVVVVFAAGFLAPRLSNYCGQIVAARLGLLIALVGGATLLIGPADFKFFCFALCIFLLGMGLFNPLGTAIALHPFSQQAGAASALLGFMQMGCAALAIALGSILPLAPYTILGSLLFGALVASFICFLAAREGSD